MDFGSILLLLVSVIGRAYGQQVTADGCFYQYNNHGLACAAPFIRQSPVNLEECQQLCKDNRDRCRSAAWNQNQQTCDLFLLTAPVPSRVTYPSGQNGGPGYGGPNPSGGGSNTNNNNNYHQSVNRNTNGGYVAPTAAPPIQSSGYSSSSSKNRNPYPLPDPPRPNPVSGNYGRDPPTQGSHWSNSFSRFRTRRRRLKRQVWRLRPWGVNNNRQRSHQPHFGFHNRNIHRRYRDSPIAGNSYNSHSNNNYPTPTSTAATFSGNYGGNTGGQRNYGQNRPGNTFNQFIGNCRRPHLAYLAGWTYLEFDATCGGGRPRPTTSRPTRTTTRRPGPGPTRPRPTTTTRRTPRPGETTTQGPTSQTPCPPLVHDNRVLVGFAEHVRETGTFEECYVACLEAQATLGFTCRSGQFFGPNTQQNCILNSEDSRSQPDLWIDWDEEPVQYFEPCPFSRQFIFNDHVEISSHETVTDHHRRRSPPSPWLRSGPKLLSQLSTWGPWTMCSMRHNRGEQKRFRRCKSILPSSCDQQKRTCHVVSRRK